MNILTVITKFYISAVMNSSKLGVVGDKQENEFLLLKKHGIIKKSFHYDSTETFQKILSSTFVRPETHHIQ